MSSTQVDSKQEQRHGHDPLPDMALNHFIGSHSLASSFKNTMIGRHIRVIAPSSGIALETINQLRDFSAACSQLAISIDIPENIVSNHIVFHANSDEERLSQLVEALYCETDNTIIWTLRGGYGCARLINHLNTLPKPKQEKTFIGFSDNTALHLFLSQHWNWKTIHGVGFARILDTTQDPYNYLKIMNIVKDEPEQEALSTLYPINHAAKKIDDDEYPCASVLTGGNLTLVENSIATCWEMDATDKIVFLEEVGERGYRVDRSLYHLRQAGLFEGAKAVILGQFTTEKDDPTIDLALTRFANEMTIPVFKTEEFGHGDVNFPLVYNTTYEILPASRTSKGYDENVFILKVRSAC